MHNKSALPFCAVAGVLLAAFDRLHRICPNGYSRRKQIEKVEVTASRRSGTLQEVPINISALTSDVLDQQNIEETRRSALGTWSYGDRSRWTKRDSIAHAVCTYHQALRSGSR